MRVKLQGAGSLIGSTTWNTNNKSERSNKTYALFVQGQHDTRFIHSTNEDQWRVVINIIVVHLDQLITPSNSITHRQQDKRTICSFRVNTEPVSYIQPSKIDGQPLSTLQFQCIRKAKWRIRVKLHNVTS